MGQIAGLAAESGSNEKTQFQKEVCALGCDVVRWVRCVCILLSWVSVPEGGACFGGGGFVCHASAVPLPCLCHISAYLPLSVPLPRQRASALPPSPLLFLIGCAGGQVHQDHLRGGHHHWWVQRAELRRMLSWRWRGTQPLLFMGQERCISWHVYGLAWGLSPSSVGPCPPAAGPRLPAWILLPAHCSPPSPPPAGITFVLIGIFVAKASPIEMIVFAIGGWCGRDGWGG